MSSLSASRRYPGERRGGSVCTSLASCISIIIVCNWLLIFDLDFFGRIRPLSLDEVKKRRISGRSQISNDGRHLLDGVPFGRPLLKRPRHRPSVHISPRKKRKISHAIEELSDAEQTPPLRLNDSDALFDEYYDEGDEDFISNSDLDDERSLTDDSSLEPEELQLLQENSYSYGSQSEQNGASQQSVVGNNRDTIVEPDPVSCVRDKGKTYLLRQRSKASTAAEPPISDGRTCYGHDSGSDGSDGSGNNDDNNTCGESSSNGSDGRRLCTEIGLTLNSVCSDYSATHRIVDRDASKNAVRGLDYQEVPSLTVNSVCETQGKARTKRRNARRRAKRAMERANEASASVTTAVETETDAHEPTLGPYEATSIRPSATFLDSSGDDPILKMAISDDALACQEHNRQRVHGNDSGQTRAGALGLRNSKKGSNESTILERPCNDSPSATETLEKVPLVSEPSILGGFQERPSHDSRPTHWRERIEYRAVECCDRSVGLSEPPFPFVQRWEKLSRTRQASGRSKAASNERETGEDKCCDTDKLASQKETWVQLSQHSTAAPSPVAMQPSPGRDNVFSRVDLPRLPPDISELPHLVSGETSAGMVITWKKWVLSKKTNWQPQVMDVTALVIDVRDDATILKVLLSQQDRKFDEEEKVYDEETGQRLYGRFEVPEADEAGEEAVTDESGVRELPFSDLIDPRILQYSFRIK